MLMWLVLRAELSDAAPVFNYEMSLQPHKGGHRIFHMAKPSTGLKDLGRVIDKLGNGAISETENV